MIMIFSVPRNLLFLRMIMQAWALKFNPTLRYAEVPTDPRAFGYFDLFDVGIR